MPNAAPDVGIREVVTEAVAADELINELAGDKAGACDEERPRQRAVGDPQIVGHSQQSAPYGVSLGFGG